MPQCCQPQGSIYLHRVSISLKSFFFFSSTTLYEFWFAQLFLSIVSSPAPSVFNFSLPYFPDRSSHHPPILILASLSVSNKHTYGRIPLDEGSARRRDRYLQNTRNTYANKRAAGGIRTRDPGNRAAADLRIRPRGLLNGMIYIFICALF